MTRFLLIRHALTDAVGKHLSGRAEGVYLNEAGRRQAEALAKRLAAVKIDAIYTSPLERAFQTAEAVANAHSLQAVVAEDFNEIDFGEWTNCNFDELMRNEAFHRFNKFRSCTRIPGGELMAEAQLRFVKGMERLYAEHANETVAIVSHADIVKACICYYAGIAIDLFARIEIAPASVSIIEMFDDTVRINLLNHTGDFH